MVDMFAFESWLKECDTIWSTIYKMWGKGVETTNENYEFMLHVFDKAARPYFFYLEDVTRTTRTQVSPFGRDSGSKSNISTNGNSSSLDSVGRTVAKSEGTRQEAGGPATAKCTSCGKPFTPKVPAAKLCLKCWIAREKQKVVKS